MKNTLRFLILSYFLAQRGRLYSIVSQSKVQELLSVARIEMFYQIGCHGSLTITCTVDFTKNNKFLDKPQVILPILIIFLFIQIIPVQEPDELLDSLSGELLQVDPQVVTLFGAREEKFRPKNNKY